MRRRYDGDRGERREERDTPQARLESHTLGRAFLSGIIIFVLAALLVTNLPSSHLKREALPVVNPLLDATALGQSWNLFAPNPRKSTLRFAARMTYPDGVTVEWRQPDSDPVVGVYRLYRWRKFSNNVLSDERQDLWPDTAAWLARTHRRNGDTPIEVVLLKQAYRAPDPGSGDRERESWREEILYRATFPEGGPT